MERIQKTIRDVKDFPKPGIVFKDITPVLQDPQIFHELIDAMAANYSGAEIDRIVGIEARGFILGAPLAYKLGVGFTIVRKPGKLPYKTVSETYELEYGTDTLEIHVDGLEKGHKALIVDDLLATGGTAAACVRLVKKVGATVLGCAFAIELDFLEGRKKLGDVDIFSLIHY